jgi:hypothetical protein
MQPLHLLPTGQQVSHKTGLGILAFRNHDDADDYLHHEHSVLVVSAAHGSCNA